MNCWGPTRLGLGKGRPLLIDQGLIQAGFRLEGGLAGSGGSGTGNGLEWAPAGSASHKVTCPWAEICVTAWRDAEPLPDTDLQEG